MPKLGDRPCLLRQHTGYFLSKENGLSKILASQTAIGYAIGSIWRRPHLAWAAFPAIHLETAAFVRHMSGETLRIIRSLRAACSEPSSGFLACPFSPNNRRPQHAGVFRHLRALPAMPPGRLRFLMERTTF
jgi:hypothetical protein